MNYYSIFLFVFRLRKCTASPRCSNYCVIVFVFCTSFKWASNFKEISPAVNIAWLPIDVEVLVILAGEIKSLPFVTQDVTKRGILRFVKLAQDEQLNRRLAVVLFEELLSTLFPDLKFNEIFNEIYQKSDRIRNINSAEKKWCIFIYQNLFLIK